jgi:hypothetical protein
MRIGSHNNPAASLAARCSADAATSYATHGGGGGKSCERQEETRAVDAAQWSGCRAFKAGTKGPG